MNLPKVTVIDYGISNILSVCRALEYCGVYVKLSSDPVDITTASRVVLPGVGAFYDSMNSLRKLGLDDAILNSSAKGIPFLGICLGMQLMFDDSEEFGNSKGLGLIPGSVVRLPIKTTTDEIQKIPHVGWNTLVKSVGCHNWTGTVLHNIGPQDAVYFTHSFMAKPVDAKNSIADCIYGGGRVPAVVGHENILGCQFHPEKSGAVGLNILRNFCDC